jgi:hypothetical protein
VVVWRGDSVTVVGSKVCGRRIADEAIHLQAGERCAIEFDDEIELSSGGEEEGRRVATERGGGSSYTQP